MKHMMFIIMIDLGEPIPSQAGYTAYKNVSGDDFRLAIFLILVI